MKAFMGIKMSNISILNKEYDFEDLCLPSQIVVIALLIIVMLIAIPAICISVVGIILVAFFEAIHLKFKKNKEVEE